MNQSYHLLSEMQTMISSSGKLRLKAALSGRNSFHSLVGEQAQKKDSEKGLSIVVSSLGDSSVRATQNYKMASAG